MAEAILRHRSGDRFEACSAGTDPSVVHPLTIQVLQEQGIDATSLHSKSIETALKTGPVDHAFAVCAAAAQRCPVLMASVQQVESWPFDDPAGDGNEATQLMRFRQARDQIAARIDLWLGANLP